MTAQPLILAIQSQVVWGHVGNSAAAHPMRAAGVAVAEVPTTLLSNHPRYPTMRGRVLEPALVADLLLGARERGLRPAWTLSGYLGSAATADAVAAHLAQAEPGMRYLCDPVMGDDDIGFFAKPDLVAAFRDRLVPMAYALTPNRFELGALTGLPVGSAADCATAARTLAAPLVAVTGVAEGETVATVLLENGRAWVVRAPRLDRRPAGTGDLFAGLLAARLALGASAPQAASRAVSGVWAALAATAPEPWAEMPLAARIAEVLDPPRLFAAVPLG